MQLRVERSWKLRQSFSFPVPSPPWFSSFHNKLLLASSSCPSSLFVGSPFPPSSFPGRWWPWSMQSVSIGVHVSIRHSCIPPMREYFADNKIGERRAIYSLWKLVNFQWARDKNRQWKRSDKIENIHAGELLPPVVVLVESLRFSDPRGKVPRGQYVDYKYLWALRMDNLTIAELLSMRLNGCIDPLDVKLRFLIRTNVFPITTFPGAFSVHSFLNFRSNKFPEINFGLVEFSKDKQKWLSLRHTLTLI